MTTQEGSPQPAASLRVLTVRLIGYDSVAQFINPLTFYWNKVVDETWVCVPGAQIGLTQSIFAYTNGVRIEATGDELLFIQEEVPLTPGSALIPGLARKYVESFGMGNWIAISLEFLADVPVYDTPSPEASGSWTELPGLFAAGGVQPAFSVIAHYDYSDRWTRVALTLDPQLDPHVLTCSGQVHRELPEAEDDAQNGMLTVLDNWESDWEEVVSTTARLLTAPVGQGGPG